MNNTTQNGASTHANTTCGFSLPTVTSRVGSIADAGQVRVGGFGPVFRLPTVSSPTGSIADAGQVRVGGFGPLFR